MTPRPKPKIAVPAPQTAIGSIAIGDGPPNQNSLEARLAILGKTVAEQGLLLKAALEALAMRKGRKLAR